jgi:tetratricopeptide (TPR) repeat protein
VPVLLILLALLPMGACRDEPPRLLEKGDPEASVAAWKAVYDEVPADDPLRVRAASVFERVRNAAGDYAELEVLEMGRSPLAFALPDEAIVLSGEGLRLCYRDASPEAGDSRLAFLLGHELAHIGAHDFWHASAFAAVRDAHDESEETTRLQALLAIDSRDRQKQELSADDVGILTAIQAGFDPQPILAGEETFFEHWVGGATGAIAYDDPDHPGVGERAVLLRRRLADVAAKKVELFDRGVAAFRRADALAAGTGPDRRGEALELYRQAVESFDRFRRSFGRVPGREALNDLALSHLRLATAELARCDGSLVNRFYLPTALDPVTLANRAIHRGAGGNHSSPCFENERYQRHVEPAIRYLEDAIERDPRYLPARLNLIAAWVLDEQDASAANLALETLNAFPDDSLAAAAWTAASLAYLETGATLYSEDRVLPQVADLRARFPEEAGIPFNLASYLTRQGRLDEATPAWRRFLELQAEGAWAEVARQWTGDDGAVAVAALPARP